MAELCQTIRTYMAELFQTFRTYIGFWVLGLCNNFGYVVILSAAHDIMKEDNETINSQLHTGVNRTCNEMSTGAILLADIVPSIVVKLVSPFCPLYMNLRIFFVTLFAATSYIIIALKLNDWIICGVMLMSVSSGLGEASLLAHTVFYKKEAISGWSSGTGGAGILGSFMYAGLIGLGVKSSTTLFMMVTIPLLMAITFWIFLPQPVESTNNRLVLSSNANSIKFSSKLKLIPNITKKFMIPYGLVYFFEYFINQGIFELMEFDNVEISLEEQYRWYNFDYQLGVFIARSSMSLIEFNKIWLLALLQACNAVVTLLEAIYSYLTYIYILFILIFWEGLIGGCCYVNTYRRISTEVPSEQRTFSMALNSFGDAIGITLAGIVAIPVHNIICKMPLNK